MSKIRKPSPLGKRDSEKSAGTGKSLSRRALLKNAMTAAVGATAAGFIGKTGARAQVQGLYTSNQPPELPLPLGSLTYLDTKQYIHNMEIISHLPGATINGGEPLMCMWAKGRQRMLPAPSRGDFVDISDARSLAWSTIKGSCRAAGWGGR